MKMFDCTSSMTCEKRLAVGERPASSLEGRSFRWPEWSMLRSSVSEPCVLETPFFSGPLEVES